MADFCAQCSVDNFGEDFHDHKGHSTPEDTARGLYCMVICEGCGVTQVDHEGRCVSNDCFINHKTGEKRTIAMIGDDQNNYEVQMSVTPNAAPPSAAPGHPSRKPKWRPLVSVDFDGVIHAYTTPWKNAWTVADGPVPGAIEALLEYLDAGYRVAISSARSRSIRGRWAMQRALATWIGEHWETGGRHVSNIEAEHYGDARAVWRKFEWPWFKAPAHVHIDDRALLFDGNWGSYGPGRIGRFKPWNKQVPEDSGLIAWARRELDAVNFGAEDTAVMLGIMRTFLDQWDSGGAVHACAPVLQRLIAGKPLSPLTGEETEWREIHRDNSEIIYQNLRLSTVFKAVSLNKKNRVIQQYDLDNSAGHRAPIKFPYYPERAEVSSPVVEVQTGPSLGGRK